MIPIPTGAPLGAFYAYEKFCEAAGVTPTTLDSFTKTSSDFTGYLAYVTSEDVLNNNPDTLDLYDPKYNYTCEISYDGQYFEETDSLNSHDESLGYACTCTAIWAACASRTTTFPRAASCLW